MQIRKVIVAMLSIAICALLVSTTGSAQATSSPPTPPTLSQVEQQGGYVWVALDTDGDRRFDDDDHDNKPDNWFKVAAKFVDSCGSLVGCLYTPPGFATLACAGWRLYKCLAAYE